MKNRQKYRDEEVDPGIRNRAAFIGGIVEYTGI